MPLCLPVFIAVGLGMVAAIPADARESSFDRFRFDTSTGALEVRGKGDAPTWTLVRESQGLAYLEFPGTTHQGRTQALSPSHPSIARILFAQNRPGIVRLAVRGRALPLLKPTVTPEGRGWVMRIPLAPPSSSSRPLPRSEAKIARADDPRRQRQRAWMGPASFDPQSGLVTIPYFGANPDWGLDAAEGNVVFAEFPGLEAPPSVWLGKTRSFNPSHAFIQRILVAQNRNGVVRLAVRGSVPIGMEVSRRRQGDHWLIVARPYPLPQPEPTPEPTPEPLPTPEPVATPVPEPEATPEPAVTPEPEPTSVIVPVAPVRSLTLPPPRITSGYGLLMENVGAEDLSLRVDDLLSVGVDWEPTWEAWSFPLHFGQQTYQFTNPDYPGTLHRRQVSVAALAVDRRYHWADMNMATGVGYHGNWASVSNSAQAPVQPAPSSLWFSPTMNLHGVELRQRIARDLNPWLGLGLDLRVSPYLFFEAPGPAMPWLSRFSLEPSVTLGARQGLRLGGFVEAIVDPGRFGGAFQQIQTGGRLQLDFGPMGRDSEEGK
ncbi:hypothetical protein D3C72_60490 [compost metagenome]